MISLADNNTGCNRCQSLCGTSLNRSKKSKPVCRIFTPVYTSGFPKTITI